MLIDIPLGKILSWRIALYWSSVIVMFILLLLEFVRFVPITNIEMEIIRGVEVIDHCVTAVIPLLTWCRLDYGDDLLKQGLELTVLVQVVRVDLSVLICRSGAHA